MSLRTKIIFLFLISNLISAGFILLYWMPKAELVIEQNLKQTTERQLATATELLVSPILQNQYGLIYENLGVLLERNPNWVSLELIAPDGQRLYPLSTVPPAQSSQYSFQLDILFRESSLATLKLIIELADEIKILRNQAYVLLSFLFVGFLIILLCTVIIIDVFVSQPVKKLSKAASQLAGGKYNSELPIASKDEIGDLVVSFTSMRTDIQQSHEQLERSNAELEDSENRFRDFGASASDWYWEMDENMRFSYFSDHFTATTGVEQNLLLGKTSQEAGKPGVTVEIWQHHLQTLADHKSFRNFIYPQTKSDGNTIWLSLNGRPILDIDGQFQGYRGTGLDITDKIIAEHDLQLAKEKAEQANMAKSEFLASMSHELRTPMTGILGFADILLDDNISSESKKKVRMIKGAANSLLRILNDILDLSKLDAGKLEIETIDFDLHALVDDVLQIVAQKTKIEQKLKIDSIFSSDFPLGVKSDPTRIRQILLNLIGNAVKFTIEGEVSIKGSLYKNATGCEHIKMSIKDSGIGIDEKIQAKLFSNFVQADASISRRYEGTGLGLAICKRLVHLMGGEIGVESTLGKGSTFWFTIPFLAATSDVGQTRDASQNTVYKSVRKLNILIADDIAVNQMIIKSIMGKYGHNTSIVENGALAVAANSNGNFDLILMDVRMPELSGPDATKLIRKSSHNADIPIIALTADAMENHKQDYFESGMNACVTKPINQFTLLETINQVMGEEIHIQIESETSRADKAAIENIDNFNQENELDDQNVEDDELPTPASHCR